MREGLRSRARNTDDEEVVGANVTNEIELKTNCCEELGFDGSLDADLVAKVRVEDESSVCEANGVGKNDVFGVSVGGVDVNGEQVDCIDINNCKGEQVDGVNCNGEQLDGVGADNCNGEPADGADGNSGLGEQADNVQSKGRRGRKRKNREVSSNAKRKEMIDLNAVFGVSVGGVDVNGEQVDGVNINNCNGEQVGAVDVVNCDGEQLEGVGADNCNGEEAEDDNANNGSGEQAGNVQSKSGRGRKRKNREVSSSAKRIEMFDLNELPVVQGSGRVLRSGTAANVLVKGDMNDADDEPDEGDVEVDKKKIKMENGEGTGAETSRNGMMKKNKGRRGRPRKVDVENGDMNDVDDELDEGVVEVDKKKLKMENDEDRSAEPSIKGMMKKKKGRLGRPPKVNVENGDMNDVDDEPDEEVVEVDKKKLKIENVEDKSAEPSRKERMKKNKGRRGRAPKVSVENGDTDVIVGKKDKVSGSKVSLKSGTTRSKLKGESGASEKKDIRNQLVNMIIRCGWNIEYVPRASRDYNDPVYVNPEGKAHWSVTKAYKDLKERIDSGKANAEEQAGFTEVPEETLSKLFQVITKKRSDYGIKRSEGVLEKEPGRNGASGKKTDDSQSGRRKRKSIPLDGRKKKRFALLARGTGNKSGQVDDESELYNRKRNLLSWMINLGTVREGEIVQYRDPKKGTVLLEGKVTHNGLSCNCCNEAHTILGFQLHAGSKLGEPLKNLYLGSELSIFQCMVHSWSQQVEVSKIGFCSVDMAGGDFNDDTCNMCGDGGDLMCCDCCPSTFHLSCLDIDDVPAGDWLCMYCTCKFCGSVSDEALGQDDGHQLITCQLCEEKFHFTCTDQTDAKCVNSATGSFCGVGCQKIFNHLQKFVGLKHEMEGGLSWTILHRSDLGNDASSSDYPLKIECNAKLAVAYSVMDECFLPVIDPRSQSDMITNVIYNCGSNFRRLNYSGFYTFILEKGDEVVSVASVRFHGSQLAEMPFIATRNMYRRQGLSRQLVTVIEKVLSSMNIQKLVIPAVSDVMAMWTDSFSFMPLEEETWQEMKTMSVIAFPFTDMLQKSLPDSTGSESERSVPEGKPTARINPEDEMVDAIADRQTADDSERREEEEK